MKYRKIQLIGTVKHNKIMTLLGTSGLRYFDIKSIFSTYHNLELNIKNIVL